MTASPAGFCRRTVLWGEMRGRIRDSPLLLSDVKARHDVRTRCGKPQISNPKPKTPGQNGDDRMVGLVETMLMDDGLPSSG
jgi:hypothetical protein